MQLKFFRLWWRNCWSRKTKFWVLPLWNWTGKMQNNNNKKMIFPFTLMEKETYCSDIFISVLANLFQCQLGRKRQHEFDSFGDMTILYVPIFIQLWHGNCLYDLYLSLTLENVDVNYPQVFLPLQVNFIIKELKCEWESIQTVQSWGSLLKN